MKTRNEEFDDLIGKRIKLINMPNDPQPIERGSWGTIVKHSKVMSDDILSVRWDNGRTLNVLFSVDEFVIFDTETE
jgi:hypothetical protein